MSNLSAFLNPVETKTEKEIIISDRFQNEDGTPAAFKIRALSQAENDAIIKQCRRTRKVNGQVQEYQDATEISRRIMVAATVFPDFSSNDMCEAYGTLNPLEVPTLMLYSGEYARLMTAIMELSGFEDGTEEEEAKN